MDNNFNNTDNNNNAYNNNAYNNNGNVNPYSASNSDYGFNTQQQYNPVNQPQKPQSDKAKISMICGILGAVLSAIGCFCCIGYVGIPLSIVAIVFAVQSKNETGGVLSGNAKAGMICGIAGLVFLLLGFLLGFVIGFVGAMNGTTIY